MASAFASKLAFDSLPIHAATKRAIAEVFKYEHASQAQSKFLPALLQPSSPDVFIKATTGSGKTLGFLIPALEAAVLTPSKTSCLILSPTRDLAEQTLAEAKKLITYHANISAASVIGGTSKSKDVRLLSGTSPPTILVATPGRLDDLLKEKALSAAFSNIRVVILDEADRLLEQGFLHAIKKILSRLPSERRTLLVTATVPDNVQDIAKQFMKPAFLYVDTVGKAKDQTQIDQYYRFAEPRSIHVALYREIRKQVAKGEYKVLAFFPSKRMVDFFARYFSLAWKLPVLKLHGDMTNGQRTANATAFRTKMNTIMFATDAAGRGMDFPDVTCVMQLGVVDDVVYRQRVGRTGRGGRRGEAVLILGTDEKLILTKLQAAKITLSPVQQSPTRSTRELGAPVGQRDAIQAFISTLGAYNSQLDLLGWKKADAFNNLRQHFEGMGLDLSQADEKTKRMIARSLKKMNIPHTSM